MIWCDATACSLAIRRRSGSASVPGVRSQTWPDLLISLGSHVVDVVEAITICSTPDCNDGDCCSHRDFGQQSKAQDVHIDMVPFCWRGEARADWSDAGLALFSNNFAAPKSGGSSDIYNY